MDNKITGLHHITAMSSDAQENVDFYAGVLGLRLVKKTINFDSPDIYHLYFGNETGEPGTILTFFPIPGMVRGRKGNGQATAVSFSIPEKSLDFWLKRLSAYEIGYEPPTERFNSEIFISLEDPDGMGIELVATQSDDRQGFTYGHIPLEHSIKGFHGVTLREENYETTAELLMSHMDHSLVAEKDDRFRFAAGLPSSGYVDILHSPGSMYGKGGSGTIHHVAFATHDDNTQLEFREKILESMIVTPTPVVDRQYFHSVYFREPGGVLFEAATSDIGFTLDESAEHLGESLKLPPWEEKNRNEIEGQLPALELSTDRFKIYAREPHR